MNSNMNYSDYTNVFITGVATEASGLFAMVPGTWDEILKIVVIVLISLFSKFISLLIEKKLGKKSVQEIITVKEDSGSETVEMPNINSQS